MRKLSKANQKAKFSIFNFFDLGKFSLPKNLDRKLIYLDSDEIISRIPQVEKALQEIKLRKRLEKAALNYFNPRFPPTRNAKAEIKFEAKNAAPDKLIHELKMHPFTKITNQIQRGFDIADKWKDEEEDKEGIGEASETN